MQRFLSVAVLLIAAASGRAQDLSVKEGKGTIEFYAGDKLITRFHHQGYAKPVFYPVNAPNGVSLTRAFPFEKGAKNESLDHPWQKSAWFCHGDVVAEGLTLKTPRKGVKGTDFWTDGFNGCGSIVCTKAEVVKKDKDHITVVTTNEWRSGDGEKILDERRVIHLYKLDGAWLIVSESDLSAPTYNIVFDDTKEGSFGIRINDQITGKSGKGRIENAEGLVGEKACWGKPSNWCDYSGPIDEKVAGIAILADPKNPSPSCFHVRDYGLMAANPFGRDHSGFPAMKGRKDVIRLQKGEHVQFRFGLLLHDGNATAGRVAQHFEQFVGLRNKSATD